MESKSISSIIDDEYAEFSMYVVENRAIASVVDGLKPSQRKILYVALKTAKNQKQKVAAIAANAASMANYNHGEASAQDACVGMAAQYNNNLPLLEEHGSFGSRLIQESAAPRYIFSRVSENFEKYFKDSEVCPKNSDPDNPEPQHYLPLIPWVLVNGVKGIAVGFATDIMPRDPNDLAKVMRCLASGKTSHNPLTPKYPDFSGTVSHVQDNQYEIKGVVTNDKLKYHITEVPYGYDREKYVSILDKLEEDNKIVSYVDSCDESGFNFTVKVTREQKKKAEEDPHAYFKLVKKHSENLTTLDENGKLKVFETVHDLVQYFYSYRVKKAGEFVEFKRQQLAQEIRFIEDKISFITDIVDGAIEISKMKKADVLDYIKDRITNEEYGKSFVNLPIYTMTQEEIDSLNSNLDSKKAELVWWENATAESYYLGQLKEI